MSRVKTGGLTVIVMAVLAVITVTAPARAYAFSMPFDQTGGLWCAADPANGAAGTDVVLWNCQDRSWFQFAAVSQGDGYNLLLPSGLCLTDPGMAGNARLYEGNCSASNGQRWYEITLGNGASVWCVLSNECISMPFAARNGAWIVSRAQNDSGAQQWDGPPA